MTSKQYIGHGVYVDMENGMIKLTAENGIYATNTIYLEPEVLHSLMGWLKENNIIVNTIELKEGTNERN